MKVSLTLTERHLAQLKAHLFPQDGCEAVAILLCGRARSAHTHRLLVQKLELIPYEECSLRLPDRVTWSTDRLPALLAEAGRRDLAIVKIHGHCGVDRFSDTDDVADRQLFPSVHAWTDSGPHASAILLDDDRVFGRTVDPDGSFADLDHVSVVGDDLTFHHTSINQPVSDFGQRIAQAFGDGTYGRLRKLRVAVIGASGTGSPVIEQLARNCVGELVLIDPDYIEEKNLNRILNTSMADAQARKAKVEVQAAAIRAMGLGTKVETHCASLFDPAVVRAVASCDVVFGCMDSIDGRHLLNKLASFYLLPYFDLGVKIEADGTGGVDQVCGTVHYLQPGGSSLLSRNVYSMEQVRAAGMYRTDQNAYRAQLEQGYIRGVAEDRPAVIQLNMLIASLAINELLARLHPYRIDPNNDYAIHRISLSHGIYEHCGDGEPCHVLARHAGKGDVYPLLDAVELSERKAAA